MGCKPTYIKEEKKMMAFFLAFSREENFTFNIEAYDTTFNHILKNSQNNFKKLEKKQKVRLNFIHEANKTIFQLEEKERLENKSKKILFFLIIYTIIMKKYIEDNNRESEDSQWIDIEQTLFNTFNNLINRNYSDHNTFLYIFYYASHLLYYITFQSKEFDNYINLEKYIKKIKECLPLIVKKEEMSTFRNNILRVLGETFEKTNNLILSKTTHRFIIEFIFSSITEKKDFIVEFNENIKNIFKNVTVYSDKENKSDAMFNEDLANKNLMGERKFIDLKENIQSFYQYVSKFTTDVTAGKKIWKEVEEYIVNIIGDLQNSSLLLEIIIIYIFNKSGASGKIILSSIFEFLCDKFHSSEHVDIPHSSHIGVNEVNELPRQNTHLHHNLNLFYEIISNHYEIILTDQILNERYMIYFARIFIEDTLNEIINNDFDGEEKFLTRLFEIVSQNPNPPKLIISLLSDISKFYLNQANMNFEHTDQSVLNTQLLDRIYKKLTSFLNKFSNSPTKTTLDRDEFFIIIQNFSTNAKILRPNYIMFFIKFFIFVEFNFKLEFEFIHRKKLYVIIFEMFYELIVNLHSYESPQMNIEEFVKLLELFIIAMKNYSKLKLEDGYLIFKIVSMIIKKISNGRTDKINEVIDFNIDYNMGNISHDNISKLSTLRESEKNKVLSNAQVVLVYGLVNIVIYLVTGFYQLNQANASIPAIHKEMLMSFAEDEEMKNSLDAVFQIIDVQGLSSTLQEFLNLLKSVNISSERIESSRKFIELVTNKYINSYAIVNNLESEMKSRKLNNFSKEFNNEMTFRDFNKLKKKDTDIFSENNYSLISSRDIENLNDITIVFTEERKSDAFRDTLSRNEFFRPKVEGEVDLNNPNEVQKYIDKPFNMNTNNAFFSPAQMYSSEMDEFLTRNNGLNRIKI